MSSSGPWIVMRPDGDLDADEASRVRRLVAGMVQSGSGRLVLDLREVGFVDSAGLGALIGAARRLAAVGGMLRIVGARQSVVAVLRSTGVAALVPIYASIEDAELDLECPLTSTRFAKKVSVDP